ncbi:hypothetical protein CLU79DRAFT_765670 [Phycomyces nitens]|nr:hypothetical protein CLU79DRAFT_765670 [Phycomyces nitens]
MADLPFEILAQIATHIKREDQRTCTLVCNSWYKPFTERLWSNIRINTKNQLSTVSGTFITHKSHSQFYSRVRILHLECPFKVNSYRLSLIQERFSFLEELHVHSNCLSSAFFSQSATNWGLWKHLTVLEFSMGQYEISPADLITVLPFVPNLKQLVYAQREAHRGLCWKDIESIHTHLQFLERLYLGAFCCTPSSKDFLGLPDLMPAKTLKTLEILDYKISPQFIYYCAWKYPNLETLEFYETFPVKHEYVNHSMALSDLLVAPAFKKLNTIRLGTNKRSRELHETLQKILAQSVRYLTHLEYSDVNQRVLDAYYQTTDDPLLQIFENYARSLRLYFPDSRNSPPQTIFQKSSRWPCLTKLDIDTPYLDLNIHHILSCCTALKRLAMTFKTLGNIPRLTKSQAIYELESLTLQDGTINSEILHLLSRRCPQLNELRLIRLDINSRIDSKEFPLGIDMRYTSLNSLVMENVFFDGLDELGSRYDVQNNIMLVYQMQSTVHNDTVSATYNNLPTQTAKMQWFHWHRTSHAPLLLGRCRKLNQMEASFTESVFRTYQYRHVYLVNQGRKSRPTKAYRDRDDWQNDLYKGHTTFVCDRVFNLVIKD